ncbi:PTS sugar transporter subunit IIA [Lactobacillus xylocopicola]|uniref:PTS fructose transporter subunit IIA n=1 Tax=Lactobacillus xylocopicola TaxID=2976676 RepID=A0ABM8BFN8_9LACO|nr:hypothetical protein [Lactobacillus xylocopicola]BDR60064.1 PTS fructose transporter subunit IIA [Lactobacillus xylocopicola]
MKIILVSHGKLAKGMKDTVEMIAGKQDNLEAYEAYEHGTSDERFIAQVKKSIYANRGNDVIIVTDLLGGSVNNEMVRLLEGRENLFLMTGMNLPLIMTLITTVNETFNEETILSAIGEGKQGVLFVNKLMNEKDEGDLL